MFRPKKPLLRAAVALSAVVFAAAVQAQTVTVSAAVSLSEAFKEIAKLYESQNTGAKVEMNFGASGALLQQIVRGAPVDVFASADEKTMADAQQRGLVTKQQVFAQNSLVAVVPTASNRAWKALPDIKPGDINRMALGNPDSVPAGRYASQALAQAGMADAFKDKQIMAQNVRQVLDYVARGEVDVGFVYGTDAAVMTDKVKVLFTVPLPQPVRYPIAVIQDSKQADAAQKFVTLVLSPQGQEVLAKHGFKAPDAK
jgi:molybdate transport system substrate-binding protein